MLSQFDFKIITSIGEFYVDVKTSKLNKHTKYTIDLNDFSKLEISQKILKKSISLAYPIDPWYDGKDWGFISLRCIKELKEEQKDLIDKGYHFVGIETSIKKSFQISIKIPYHLNDYYIKNRRLG